MSLGGKLVKQDTSGTVTSMPTGKKKAELTLLKALSPPATPEPKGKRAQLDARANVEQEKETPDKLLKKPSPEKPNLKQPLNLGKAYDHGPATVLDGLFR